MNNDAEYYIEVISGRIDQLLRDRSNMRKELMRRSAGNIAQNEAYIQAFMSRTVINAACSARLERLSLMLRVST